MRPCLACIRSRRRLRFPTGERPKAKPEPEEAAAEYHAGSYVESGTLVTVYVELASPLGAEGKPKPKAELQRMITLIRYADTPVLHALASCM